MGGPRRRGGRGWCTRRGRHAGADAGKQRRPGRYGTHCRLARPLPRCPIAPRTAVGGRRTGTARRRKAGARAPDARPGAPLQPRPLSGAAPSSLRRPAGLSVQVSSPRRSLLPAPAPCIRRDGAPHGDGDRRCPIGRSRSRSPSPGPGPGPSPHPHPHPGHRRSQGPRPRPHRLRASDRVRWAIATTAASMKRPSGRAWAPGVVVAALRMVSAWSSSAGVGR